MSAWKKKCVALAAPSGGGKTTLCRMLLEKYPAFALSISFTTRAPRGAEKNGVEYNFVTREHFEELIHKRDLLEWAKVYDNYYGTSKAFIESQTKQGKIVLLDVDVQGVDSLKKAFGKDALSVFVLPPSLEELEQRLRARSTETEEKIQKRLAAAKAELARAKDFDHQIVNHKLEESFAELCAIVEREVGLC